MVICRDHDARKNRKEGRVGKAFSAHQRRTSMRKCSWRRDCNIADHVDSPRMALIMAPWGLGQRFGVLFFKSAHVRRCEVRAFVFRWALTLRSVLIAIETPSLFFNKTLHMKEVDRFFS